MYAPVYEVGTWVCPVTEGNYGGTDCRRKHNEALQRASEIKPDGDQAFKREVAAQQRPIPEAYNQGIQQAMTATAGTYGGNVPGLSVRPPINVTGTLTPKTPLGIGSTASLAKGTTLARNLREQLAISESISRASAGAKLPLKMSDPRWPATSGWVKMQQIIQSGGREAPINVHYVYNTITGEMDDFKIVLPGAR